MKNREKRVNEAASTLINRLMSEDNFGQTGLNDQGEFRFGAILFSDDGTRDELEGLLVGDKVYMSRNLENDIEDGNGVTVTPEQATMIRNLKLPREVEFAFASEMSARRIKIVSL